ncbi:hypothetical protein AXG93_2390s1000 [Marchantia polymorpha subsp. ruderalis]|uniref:Uncharacterized protein n=3 Tax=Marchantia polymorpha TaxID=3197 RepID=A0A176WC65_MARPO|nr:hypothetical protein AXG93_2390s1000 [Marchantia polymorpha subsp. ruderalis]
MVYPRPALLPTAIILSSHTVLKVSASFASQEVLVDQSTFKARAQLSPTITKPVMETFFACGNISALSLKHGPIVQALGCVTVSMSFEPFKPPTCDHHLLPTMCDKPSVPQRVFFYGSLYLMALGAGGIKACVTAFSADQFDDTDPGQNHERVSFMNWWWFSLSVERIMGSVAFFPWVQEQYGWV